MFTAGGAILYELLTSRTSFSSPTPLETLQQIEQSEPTNPLSLNKTIAHDLCVICLKCLEKDPGRRYSTAQALAEDLEHWLRNEPMQARRAGPLVRIQRWTRRNRVGAALILTLCVGLVAQSKLAEAGVTGQDLSSYNFLDSKTEFTEDLLDRGYEKAVARVGEQNSHAEVIERILEGTCDGGGVRAPIQISSWESIWVLASPCFWSRPPPD